MWPWKNPPSLPPNHWVVTSIWRNFSSGNLSSKPQCPILMSPIKYSSPGESVSTFIALTAHCTSVTHAASLQRAGISLHSIQKERQSDSTKAIYQVSSMAVPHLLLLSLFCSSLNVSFFQSSGKRNKAIDAWWEGNAVNFFLLFVLLPNNLCLF